MKNKLQTNFVKSIELTAEEKAINEARTAKGWQPYIKLACACCGTVSRLA
ncbi:MAG: hypothetical protein AB7U82_27930 [Blastocatellales bacterium]